MSFESAKEESSLTIQPTAEKSILTQLFETYDRLKLSLKNLDFKSFGLQFDHVDNLMNELKSNNETVKLGSIIFCVKFCGTKMPTYEYKCKKCKKRFEVFQSITKIL